MKTVLTIILLLVMGSFVSQTNWTSKKKKDGVEVFVKEENNSILKSYKAVSSTKAPIDDCVSFLLNLENHVNWSYSVVESSILKTDPGFQICYMKMDAPWPADDRDIVIKATKMVESENRVEVKLTAIDGNDLKPPKREVVRIEKSTTNWIFERENGITHITYFGITDPGGNVPDWIINAGLVDGPFETLKKFVESVSN